jgi:Bacterial protein of unknown function (DUF899)
MKTLMHINQLAVLAPRFHLPYGYISVPAVIVPIAARQMNSARTFLFAFALVAKSPIDRLSSFVRERGWMNLRLVSSAGTTYNNRNYHGKNEGEQAI